MKFLSVLFLLNTGAILLQSDIVIKQLVSGDEKKIWKVQSVSPVDPCQSNSDDGWTFFHNETFEYNHGNITEDSLNRCSDFINLKGKWELYEGDTRIRVYSLTSEGSGQQIAGSILDGAILNINEESMSIHVDKQENPVIVKFISVGE